MPLLPRVSSHTRSLMESACSNEEQAAVFIRDVFGKLVNTNPQLAGSIYLACTENEPIWGGTGIIMGCQIVRAIEIEMVRLPTVTESAAKVIAEKFSSEIAEDYWMKCQNSFSTENPELAKLVDSNTKIWRKRSNTTSVAGVTHVAVMVYTLLKTQQTLEGEAFCS